MSLFINQRFADMWTTIYYIKWSVNFIHQNNVWFREIIGLYFNDVLEKSTNTDVKFYTLQTNLTNYCIGK